VGAAPESKDSQAREEGETQAIRARAQQEETPADKRGTHAAEVKCSFSQKASLRDVKASWAQQTSLTGQKAPEEPGAVQIPGGEACERPFALVRMLHPHVSDRLALGTNGLGETPTRE
jgi:hypothetical protein